jgi:hypothetical protein
MNGFLQGPEGNNSSARLMAGISLLAAILFGGIVVTGKGSANGDMIVYAFLGAAMGGNLVNKAIEAKKGMPDG